MERQGAQGTAPPISLENEGSRVLGGASSFSSGFGASTKSARNEKIEMRKGFKDQVSQPRPH